MRQSEIDEWLVAAKKRNSGNLNSTAAYVEKWTREEQRTRLILIDKLNGPAVQTARGERVEENTETLISAVARLEAKREEDEAKREEDSKRIRCLVDDIGVIKGVVAGGVMPQLQPDQDGAERVRALRNSKRFQDTQISFLKDNASPTEALRLAGETVEKQITARVGTKAAIAKVKEEAKAAKAKVTEEAKAAKARATEDAKAAKARAEEAKAEKARASEEAKVEKARASEEAKAEKTRASEEAKVEKARASEEAKAEKTRAKATAKADLLKTKAVAKVGRSRAAADAQAATVRAAIRKVAQGSLLVDMWMGTEPNQGMPTTFFEPPNFSKLNFSKLKLFKPKLFETPNFSEPTLFKTKTL